MSDTRKKNVSSWKTLWIWVVLAFFLLIGAWVTLISLASKHAPEPISTEVPK